MTIKIKNIGNEYFVGVWCFHKLWSMQRVASYQLAKKIADTIAVSQRALYDVILFVDEIQCICMEYVNTI